MLRTFNSFAAAALITMLAGCGGSSSPPVSPSPPALSPGQPPGPPVSLSIAGMPAAPLLPGQSAQLTATLAYADASTKDVTATATWSSTDANVLVVSSGGVIVAAATGQAEVSAAAEGQSTRGAVRVAQGTSRLALFAGSLGGRGDVDGAAAQARFAGPTGLAADSAGNLYVADTDNSVIRRVSASGEVTTVAGAAGVAGSVDGPAAEARFNQPVGVAIGADGSLYVADTGNHTIRKITPTGLVSTLAGAAGQSGSADGSAAQARFSAPQGIAVDGAGNIYVADTGNYIIRRVTGAGQVTTLAGLAGTSGSADGVGSTARFGGCVGVPVVCRGPTALAVAGAGALYVADTGNYTIRRITPAGTVSTFAGRAGEFGTADGPAADARFGACIDRVVINVLSSVCTGPTGIALDAAGSVYVFDAPRSAIRQISPARIVETLIASTTEVTGVQPVAPSLAGGLAMTSAGDVFVADTVNHTLRRWSAAGGLRTDAGAALLYGSDDGADAAARFGRCVFQVSVFFDCQGPMSVSIGAAGSVLVADTNNGTIRKIDAAGATSTFAGSAGQFGSTDGASAQARFRTPRGVASDASGNLYVADTGNHTIRRITAAAVVSTLAGVAGQAGGADGIAALARFSEPSAVATDAQGNVYVADTGNHTVRRITPTEVVSTLAGLAGQRGNSDGNGTQARFDGPSGVAVDSAGNVYVADRNNHTIRKITSSGVVSTLAGAPGQSGNADGIGASARFSFPQGIAVDDNGNVYVADTGNHTIRKITPAGIVITVIGTAGRPGFAPGALTGGLTAPRGIAIHGKTLYIATLNGIAQATDLP